MKSDKKENDGTGTRKSDTFVFLPQEITLADDAFHGSKGLQFTEWWYFDAVLNDGYSIQFSLRILSGLKLSFLFVRFDIYKDGHLVVHKRTTHLLKDTKVSKEKPYIKINNNIMEGSVDKKTGAYVYDIAFDIEDISTTLHFTGITKGWKGQHDAKDWWAVILPRATVTGTVKLPNRILTLQGSGYHDHNWDVKIFALRNIGWYWGKIYSERVAITWASILRTTIKNQPLLVINTMNKGYINIQPKDFQFLSSDISEENGKMIPHTFNLNAHTESLSLQVTMKTIDIHHVKIFPLMDYWRYHVKCTGSVTINSDTESIDDLYIAEFLKFR
jgi:hypothetical protein